MKRWFFALLSVPLGCAPLTPGPEPLASLRTVDVVASGRLSSTGLAEPAAFEEKPDAQRWMEGTCRVLSVDSSAATRLFGVSSSGVDGRIVSTAALQARLADPSLDVMELTITVADGQRGYMALLNQSAFVKEARITVTRDALLLDPQIDVAQEGLRVVITPAFAAPEGPWSLQVGVESVTLARPMAEVAIPTFTGNDVTLQAPYFSQLEMNADADLVDSESLLLALRNIGHDDQVLIVLVTPTAASGPGPALASAVAPGSGSI